MVSLKPYKLCRGTASREGGLEEHVHISEGINQQTISVYWRAILTAAIKRKLWQQKIETEKFKWVCEILTPDSLQKRNENGI